MSDSFDCLEPLHGHPALHYASLTRAEAHGAGPLSRLPFSLRVLAEQLLRREDDVVVRPEHVRALTDRAAPDRVVPFHPSRVLLQDSSGLPVLADLLALREAVVQEGGDVRAVTPRVPMDLVVDHAVEADHWGSATAGRLNIMREYERHHDRYAFLAWAAEHLPGLTVVPPGVGICHQLNLEVIATLVTAAASPDGRMFAGFDTMLGTDSHTPMINALSVLAWGVGGIEATAAVLGQPVWMAVPEVVGVRLVGELSEGVLASDLALTLTEQLRGRDLVQRFVEFCGPGLASLALPDRATMANMAPEYGATVSYFPPDLRTLDYLRSTGRPATQLALVETYLRAQAMWWTPEQAEPDFDEVIEVDLGSVTPSVAGPHRPSQRLALADLPATVPTGSPSAGLANGDIVIAAITSCTNTSNPRAMIAAGLLAKAAKEHGLCVSPRVKTTFAPGSRVAARLLEATGLQEALDAQGFHVAGYGCMTCMGNSGELDPALEREITDNNIAVAAVLSGNRNFEGRVHPLCQLAYLASPPLVVAYALAGRMDIDLDSQPLGMAPDGAPVHLRDLWPSGDAIEEVMRAVDRRGLGVAELADGEALSRWSEAFPVTSTGALTYPWQDEAGFIRRPPFVTGELADPQITGDIRGARPLLVLGDAITTDHISPVTRISADSEAGTWLSERGVPPREHASFSARRLNHDVMLRGGFANAGLRNLLVEGSRGGVTRLMPEGEVLPVHRAARAYRRRGVAVVVVAGEHYGAGSARDWAAKVTRMLGVRVVLARSFERIHRANLVAMGVLPLQLPEGRRLALDGTEMLDLLDLLDATRPGGRGRLIVHRAGQHVEQLELRSTVLTTAESAWLCHGGVLPAILARALQGRT